nr:3874_t:CDS:2 [Entrophospora candida]
MTTEKLYENLKRLIVGRISILIVENSLDYSSDYKDEMMELDNLKDILEFEGE